MKGVGVLPSFLGLFLVDFKFSDQKLDHLFKPVLPEDREFLDKGLIIGGDSSPLHEFLNDNSTDFILWFWQQTGYPTRKSDSAQERHKEDTPQIHVLSRLFYIITDLIH